jgi:hypothetical protein
MQIPLSNAADRVLGYIWLVAVKPVKRENKLIPIPRSKIPPFVCMIVESPWR